MTNLDVADAFSLDMRGMRYE